MLGMHVKTTRIGWVVAAGGLLALVAQRVSLAKDIRELPRTLLEWTEWVSRMFTDATPNGWAILAAMIAGLVIATSEWWLPWARAKVDLGRDRISLVDLSEIAKTKFGWKFGDDSLESLDYIAAIKQGHSDGHIELEGRANLVERDEEGAIFHTLAVLPRSYFDDSRWHINVPKNFDGTKNFDVYTYCMGMGNVDFRDLHIRDAASAKRWLRTEAQKYRGQAERLVNAGRSGRP